MCTVSFIPLKDKILLTSNRDEKHYRKQALHPAVYTLRGNKTVYPKDADAGGTWIAMQENGNAAVLLNGAFINHVPKSTYSKSRGLILLDIIEAVRPVQKFLQNNLVDIAPFTLVVINNGLLYECRWDGYKTHCRQLPLNRPAIWSSATLYSMDVIKKREQWFAAWLNRNPNPSQEDVIKFHLFGGDAGKANNLWMNRDGLIYTVSVTSIELSEERCSMHYLDLKDFSTTNKEIRLSSPCAI